MGQASWIAEILLAALLAAIIIFGSRISFGARIPNKLDRIEEGLIHNGKRLDRVAEVLSQNAPPGG